MSEGSSSNSNVGIVAIVALVLVGGVAAWFIWGRTGSSQVPAAATTSQPADAGINVKINLPDSVTINP